HTLPVPRLGGIAVFAAFAGSVCGGRVLLKHLVPSSFHLYMPQPFTSVMVAAGMVFAIGVYDDLRGCSAWPKLMVEAAGATILFLSGVRIGAFPSLDSTIGTVLSYAITVLFVVAVTNGFNLIDGLDGLAAGSATFSAVAVAIVAGINHRGSLLLMVLGLAGVLLGFLRFNFSRATIFLGDSGSLFIGFVLSAAALSGAQKLPTSVGVVTTVMLFATPIVEVCLSVTRRSLGGRPIFSADRDHIHHRLLQLGFSQRQAVLALYATSGGSALLAVLLLYSDARSAALVVMAFLTGTAVLIRKLEYEELREIYSLLALARARCWPLGRTELPNGEVGSQRAWIRNTSSAASSQKIQLRL
ncbi:MAG TPA: MraY family glycosyltransferase, partial [Terriglobales bacterium]